MKHTQSFPAGGLHSYILKGSGEGALRRGREFAMALLCPEGDAPCGHCASCRQFVSGAGDGKNHPDYFEILPSKKTRNASIKKEMVEDVIEEASMTSYLGGGKVFLFSEFEKTTVEGQNALLKLLEEPPAKTSFLLLSAHPDRILPTVRSRSGYYELRVEEAETDPVLKRETFAMLHRLFARREEAFLARKLVEEKKDDIDPLFACIESYLRDMAVWLETKDENRLYNGEFRTQIAADAEKAGPRVYDMIEALYTVYDLKEHNVNRDFAIEWMLLEFGG